VDIIGADNGYIMCEGCFLSAHSKVENVRAMIEVAKIICRAKKAEEFDEKGTLL
jgi:hypothetical protein